MTHFGCEARNLTLSFYWGLTPQKKKKKEKKKVRFRTHRIARDFDFFAYAFPMTCLDVCEIKQKERVRLDCVHIALHAILLT